MTATLTILSFYLFTSILPVFQSTNKCFLTITSHEEDFSKKLYLKSFIGTTSTLIDSAIFENDSFCFSGSLPQTGYYRVLFNDTNYCDIILVPSEVAEFNLKGQNLNEGLTVIRSVENSLLWKLKEKKSQVNKVIKNLIIEASYLEKESPSYKTLLNIKDSIENSFDEFSRKLIKENPSTFFASTTNGLFLPIPSDTLEYTIRYRNNLFAFQKDHFFDNINFSDPNIVRTTLLPNRYMKYLESYTEYSEEGFKNAVDLILSKASSNDQVYDLTLQFLMDLFGQVGPELIFEYIVEKYYLNNSCNDINLNSSELEKKTMRYRSLMIDQVVPLVSINDTSGAQQSLKETLNVSKVTILFFWSSHCGFCQQELILLKELYSQFHKKGLGIYAISLDQNKGEWKSAIINNNLNWINVSELKGWESESAREFMVNKTPTTYLLDQNGRILAKNIKGESLKGSVISFLKSSKHK